MNKKPKLATIQKGDDEKYPLSSFEYQKILTPKLDARKNDFNQEIINEIVLWKVNRYAELSDDLLALINKISPNDLVIDETLTREVLEGLLNTAGVRLAMASTILRFKNSHIYQIIDQRVYRYVYGECVKYPYNKEKQVDFYLDYLKILRKKCKECNVPFEHSDRILYLADKEKNKSAKIEY